MKKIKRTITIIIFIIIVSLQSVILADDEAEEEFDFSQIDSFLQAVNSETDKLPNINSRHAIVYDRNTRKNFVWKKRK